jgi:hypothetical protein
LTHKAKKGAVNVYEALMDSDKQRQVFTYFISSFFNSW